MQPVARIPDRQPSAAERIVGAGGDHRRKLGLVREDRRRHPPLRVDALPPDPELADRGGILGVADRDREHLGSVLDAEVVEPHLGDVHHQSGGRDLRQQVPGGQPHHRSRGRDPGIEPRVQTRHGLEAQAMASGDVEQRILRLDEVGLERAERRVQGAVDVDVGRASRRGRRDRTGRACRHTANASRAARAPQRCALLAAALLAGCAPAPAEPLPGRPAGAPRRRDLAAGRSDLPAHRAHRGAQERAPAGGPLRPRARRRDDGRPRPRAGRPEDLAGRHRTPEGSYVVSGPAQRNRFHRFIPIDYPSRRDADAALASGAISAAEHARILARRAHDRPPPQDTALGGGLGLHGEGPRWRGESAALDWTFGCVAVRDHEIDFLAQRVKVGTPVWIVP